MQGLSDKGMEMHWRADGPPDAPQVLFANSLGTDLRIWDEIIDKLTLQVRAIRYDARGHGLSSVGTPPYSIESLADDLACLLDRLGIRSVVVVGLSIGGMVAQSLAARWPELVKAIVLCNTACQMGEPRMWQHRIARVQAEGLEGIADAVLARWFAKGTLDRDDLFLWRNMLTRTTAEGYAGCCAAIAAADLTPVTEALRLPVLGVGGTEDLACSSDQVAQTVARIPGSRFVELAKVGHLSCVEAPAPLASLISDFMKEIGHV